MTEQEQLAAINQPNFLSSLVAKMQSTLGVLSANELQVPSASFPVSGVVCTLYMPKGSVTARVTLGERDDGTPIIELATVPVGWVTPSAPAA